MRSAPLLAVLALIAVPACQPTAETPTGALSSVSQVEQQRLACEARGGRWGSGGLAGFMTCFETPRDAGKSCKRSTDCSTNLCLARSGTCAPITPLFGCNETLDGEGRRVSLCVD